MLYRSKKIFINTVIEVITTMFEIIYGIALQSVNSESTTHNSVCQKHHTSPWQTDDFKNEYFLLNSSRINPRQPSSSPVGPEVKERKILRGSAVVPELIYESIGLPSIKEKMKRESTLMPKVSPKESSKYRGLTFPEKHLLTKAFLVSSGLKNFQPIKSKSVGDHASRFRTTHIITGGAWKTILAVPATKIIRNQIKM